MTTVGELCSSILLGTTRDTTLTTKGFVLKYYPEAQVVCTGTNEYRFIYDPQATNVPTKGLRYFTEEDAWDMAAVLQVKHISHMTGLL